MNEKMKKRFSANSFKYGTFSLVLSVFVIAVIVIVNIAADLLPSAVKNIDISEQKTYSIGEITKDVVSSLKQDVTIYLLGKDGKYNERLIQLTDKYADLSGHLKVEQIDPDEKPTFLTDMDISSDDLSGNTDVLVASSERHKFVSYNDIYKVDQQSYMYYRMGYTNSYSAYFDGEGAITSAISYCTSEDLPKMYLLKGHNEKDLNEKILDLLSKANVTTADLNLISAGAVPEDCDVLMIYLPSTDFTAAEVDALENYVAHDGKCIIFNSMTGITDMANYKEFLRYYGVGVTEKAYIFEGVSNSLPNYRFMLYEPAEKSGIEDVSGYIFAPYSSAILQYEDMRKTLSVTSLLSSSDDSWLRMDLESESYDEKIDSDIDGPFDYAVSIVDRTNEGEGKIVLFASEYFLEYSSFSEIGNTCVNGDAFVSVLSGLASLKASVSIPAKQSGVTVNTFTAAEFRTGLGIFVIAIPVCILLAGLCIWLSRRRR